MREPGPTTSPGVPGPELGSRVVSRMLGRLVSGHHRLVLSWPQFPHLSKEV